MNVLILDDDIEVANNLAQEITKLFPNFTVECYNKVNDLLLDINSTSIAIVFLDIFIPGTSGIELSNDIFSKNKNVSIVLYSGKPKETFDVYEGNHIYFLEKPFVSAKVKKAIEIASAHLEQVFFTFEFARKKYTYSLNNIVYLESSARLIKLITTSETKFFYGVLDKVNEEWGTKFLRVSKSFLVNPNFVEKVAENFIYLKKVNNPDAAEKIQISRSYKKKVFSYDLFSRHF